MLIYFGWTHIFLGLAALAVAWVVLWKQKRSFSYLLFFSIFWVYMMGVVSVAVFPFSAPESNPYSFFLPQINLVPFRFGNCQFVILCIRNIYENILLTLPFGIGISFIAKVRPGNIPWLALLVGFVFEFIQFVISLIVRSGFRVADINDVILNATGVLLGYGVFRVFAWLYLLITQRFEINNKHLFAYIYDVVRQSTDY